VNPLEHGETLPAGSVAVARKEVVVLSATETVIPGEANLAAEPAPTGGPAQVAFS
jgi:hypothetical protein